MKSRCFEGQSLRVVVAPHWGAWIEITSRLIARMPRRVAPHWGAWIEMRCHIAFELATCRTPLGCVD